MKNAAPHGLTGVSKEIFDATMAGLQNAEEIFGPALTEYLA